MRVDGSFLFGRSVLLDAASRPVLTVQRRPSLFEARRTWKAFKGDSTSSDDLLFSAVVRPSLTNTGDIHVHLDGERRRDFVGVRPWYRGTDCAITHAGATVAQIESSGGFLSPAKYDVRVNEGVYHAFVLGLTVVLEGIRLDDAEQERSRARNNKRTVLFHARFPLIFFLLSKTVINR
ncbi:hypothetical protein CFC21_074389 [Triticum aestivum]|uniref:Uncharacterized protein n=2 Tax=Triticum aestivum TaxID=4565 RepID=A0A9R1HN86_WHEAT|nr:protein LURP-one-related 9-like [Triticum aestivum]XP_044379137.1 protein LURP-one-related 9-like [Triticum aestivum]XP_044379138.1 protein LURP-one-related 9-like [Triticum aestivum]XP_044379139.1 protein LURP-one-related 9-like [Triticum aestivum]XP_044391203.1 protein LURP-one-related 9-like [Triticum aestivum]XP_044391204.1 protein LURP-one-related 9-like [Triticum aestivum]XP_044391205.1 protein LURP-one-related 9-like [Triticum aestivum]XP_044391206.1 protein LURP-one-related 9-like